MTTPWVQLGGSSGLGFVPSCVCGPLQAGCLGMPSPVGPCLSPSCPSFSHRLLQVCSQDPEETARLDPALPSASPPDLPQTPGLASFKGPREELQFFTGGDAKSNPQGEKMQARDDNGQTVHHQHGGPGSTIATSWLRNSVPPFCSSFLQKAL